MSEPCLLVVVVGHLFVLDGLLGPLVDLIAEVVGHEAVLPLGLFAQPAHLELKRVSHFVVERVQAASNTCRKKRQCFLIA
jgi:hypothetical protein